MKQVAQTEDQYAIIQTGGKQYQAILGKTLAVELLDGDIGDVIEFDQVLFKKSGADQFAFGQPYLDGSVVRASIVKHDKGPKLTVFRFKRRKKVRVKQGHRQPLTVVRIESI